jgi:hypothetical protein
MFRDRDTDSCEGTVSIMRVFLTNDNLKLRSGIPCKMRFTSLLRPRTRIVGSGNPTFSSSARLFHLNHFLKVEIAEDTVVASVGDSNEDKMADRSASPPG